MAREDPPKPKRSSPELTLLVQLWHEAQEARDFHFARGGSKGNIEMAFAGHKMDWLKWIIRLVDELPQPPNQPTG